MNDPGTLGNHFGTSGAPRGSILPPVEHPGEPWEQQDGFEVVFYRILLDLGVSWGANNQGFRKQGIKQINFPQIVFGRILRLIYCFP